jgi:hypothetical protein
MLAVELPVQERNEPEERLVERLRQAVTAAGGPSRVSRLSGVPLRTLGNYLKGRPAKITAIVAIAHVCKVSVEWLATGERQPAQPAAPSVKPPLFQIVDMGLLDEAVKGAIQIFAQRGAEPEGENFARIICLLYDEAKKRKEAAIAAGLYVAEIPD